jgi:hypothetical protein
LGTCFQLDSSAATCMEARSTPKQQAHQPRGRADFPVRSLQKCGLVSPYQSRANVHYTFNWREIACQHRPRGAMSNERGETPNVHLNARQKWPALRSRSCASSRMGIFLDRLTFTCAKTLRVCHAGRPPRATCVSKLDGTWMPLGPRLGFPRRSATAYAMCTLVASRSPSRALHAASTSCAATTDDSCGNVSSRNRRWEYHGLRDTA